MCRHVKARQVSLECPLIVTIAFVPKGYCLQARLLSGAIAVKLLWLVPSRIVLSRPYLSTLTSDGALQDLAGLRLNMLNQNTIKVFKSMAGVYQDHYPVSVTSCLTPSHQLCHFLLGCKQCSPIALLPLCCCHNLLVDRAHAPSSKPISNAFCHPVAARFTAAFCSSKLAVCLFHFQVCCNLLFN